jgi:hypothetical protein
VDLENANKIAVETKVIPGNVVLSACVLLRYLARSRPVALNRNSGYVRCKAKVPLCSNELKWFAI